MAAAQNPILDMICVAIALLALTSAASAKMCFFSYRWMDNAIGDDPCAVAGRLNSPCVEDPSKSNIGYVPWNSSTYPPPGDPGAPPATPCVCNTIYYNLIQACSVCQTRLVGRWSDWQRNCKDKNVNFYPKFENKSLLVFAPTWAYQNVLGTNAFNPQLALRTSGKKVPPSAKYALLSPKARIAVIVLSSIGAFFTLVAALLSCVRCKRQRSRKTEEESPPIEDDEGDMDEEKEQQQGLLNAEAPIGKVDDSPTIKTYDTDSSFAPQYNYSLTDTQYTAPYPPSTTYNPDPQTYQSPVYWNTASK